MTTTTKATKQNKKPTVAHAPQYPAVGMVSVWDFLGFFFFKAEDNKCFIIFIHYCE